MISERGVNKRFRGTVNVRVGKVAAKICPEPNVWTGLGLLSALAAALVITQYGLIIGAVAILASCLFDLIDGAVAKETGKVTKFGGFLDTIADRLGEAAFFWAIFQVTEESLIFVALATSLIMSYSKHAAEGMGFKITAGEFLGRPLRITLLVGLMGLSPLWAIASTIWILIFLNLWATGLRIVQVWEQRESVNARI